jgi:N-acetyl sugar amidotransferase
MDTSDDEITFDANGFCNHCTGYFEILKNKTYQGAESDRMLEQLVTQMKNAGRDSNYDCVIGISGGVDSIYTAWLAKKLGLRPLTVHMDNGWNSELAVSNIEKVLNKLGLELYTVVLDWLEFADLQLAFLKASVPEAETPTDMAIPAVLHSVAAKHRIKYIFSGGNYVTEGILPKSWHYDAKDVTYLKAIHRRFGTKKLHSFPTFGYRTEAYYKMVKGIRMIYPLNLIPYNKTEAMKVLETELDWKYYGGKHHESLYTKWIQAYLLPVKFGIEYRKATYSTQICAGELTREEALADLQNPSFKQELLQQENDYICKKLNLSQEQLNTIVSAPPKCYRDYPNSKGWLEFVYGVYRKVTG